MLKVLLQRPVLVEQLLDLLLIPRQDLRSLVIEGLLNIVQLVRVVGAHLAELELHAGNEEIDVVILLLERSDILVVLSLQLLEEELDQVLLLGDDLSARLLLLVDVLDGYVPHLLPGPAPRSLPSPRGPATASRCPRSSCDW